MKTEQQSYPACGERRNLETRPKVTIVLDERGEPVDKPRLAESMASATEIVREFKSWLAGGMRGYADICFRVDKLIWDVMNAERAVAEIPNPGNGLQKERVLDTTYGDDQILKANS